ncbi:MAG: hypothetical protein WC683_05845 [bacterium]
MTQEQWDRINLLPNLCICAGLFALIGLAWWYDWRLGFSVTSLYLIGTGIANRKGKV